MSAPEAQIVDVRVPASAPRAAQAGLHPFPPLRRPVNLAFLPHGRFEISISKRLPAFRPSAKLVPPTTPSADFSAAVRRLSTRSVRCPGHDGDLPAVRSTAFPARPPDLPPQPLMTVDFAIRCSLVRLGRPRYPVFVHRAAGLLHASFRPHLAVTPLRFANPSPPSGWVKDFHLQAVDHARHTTNKPGLLRPGL